MFSMCTDKIPLDKDVLCSSCQDNIDFKCTFFISSERKYFYLGIKDEKNYVDLYFSLSLYVSVLSYHGSPSIAISQWFDRIQLILPHYSLFIPPFIPLIVSPLCNFYLCNFI